MHIMLVVIVQPYTKYLQSPLYSSILFSSYLLPATYLGRHSILFLFYCSKCGEDLIGVTPPATRLVFKHWHFIPPVLNLRNDEGRKPIFVSGRLTSDLTCEKRGNILIRVEFSY